MPEPAELRTMRPEDVPTDLMDRGRDALVRWTQEQPPHLVLFPTFESQVRVVLAAVYPEIERRVDEALRASIIKGIKEYFASVDDDLYDDVETLCGRIERGEYGRTR